jgi:hypothetical protein
LTFWTLPIVLYLYLKQLVGDWTFLASSGESLPSWTQSRDLDPIVWRQGLTLIFFSIILIPLWSIGLISQFHDYFTDVGLLGRVMSSSQNLYLNTGQHKQRLNAYTHQISMPCVGFELTIPASERVKTVHALDGLATVTGLKILAPTGTETPTPRSSSP